MQRAANPALFFKFNPEVIIFFNLKQLSFSLRNFNEGPNRTSLFIELGSKMSSLMLLSSSANILNVETMPYPGVWCDEGCFPLEFYGACFYI